MTLEKDFKSFTAGSIDLETFVYIIYIVTESCSFSILATFFTEKFETKLVNTVVEAINLSREKGKQLESKFEGSSFGYFRYGFLDSLVIYLDKMFKFKLKEKSELGKILVKSKIIDVFKDLLSISTFQWDISLRGANSMLNLIYTCQELQNVMFVDKQFVKLIVANLDKQKLENLRVWPHLSKVELTLNIQNFILTSLLTIQTLLEKNQFFFFDNFAAFLSSLVSTFSFVSQDYYFLVIRVLQLLISYKQDSDILNLTFKFLISKDNLKFTTEYGLFEYRKENNDTLKELVSLLATLCRKNEAAYMAIDRVGILPVMRDLFGVGDNKMNAKLCNLLGNMLKHNNYFKQRIVEYKIHEDLITCCKSEDRSVRKFSCFALGNSVFLDDYLYHYFSDLLPILSDIILDSDDGARANSAGAIGNFARLSVDIYKEIFELEIIDKMVKVLEEFENTTQTIKVITYSLGNILKIPKVKQTMRAELQKRLDKLIQKNKTNSTLKEFFSRLESKLK